jgi:hypothetical protein
MASDAHANPNPDPISMLSREYGLAPDRVATIAAETAVLAARVMVLAKALPFDAEPWGFGAELLRLAHSNET